jgi:hypothetical protein|tara:strand:+ start:76 stop:513 length:438 start_codon:yes stop_codon:yes gene_type:complete
MNVHFITLGKTHENIWPLVERYIPSHVIFFSSTNLKKETETLVGKLKAFGISADIVFLRPFRNDSLRTMNKLIDNTYSRIKSKYDKMGADYYMGVTGGTNLMVLAAGLVAVKRGINILYAINPEYVESDGNATDPIIEVDTDGLL